MVLLEIKNLLNLLTLQIQWDYGTQSWNFDQCTGNLSFTHRSGRVCISSTQHDKEAPLVSPIPLPFSQTIAPNRNARTLFVKWTIISYLIPLGTFALKEKWKDRQQTKKHRKRKQLHKRVTVSGTFWNIIVLKRHYWRPIKTRAEFQQLDNSCLGSECYF